MMFFPSLLKILDQEYVLRTLGDTLREVVGEQFFTKISIPSIQEGLEESFGDALTYQAGAR